MRRDNQTLKVLLMQITLLLLVILLLSTSIKSDIIIRSPLIVKNKFEKSTIKTSYATFGYNPYGYTLSGKLYYDPINIDKDLACDYNNIKDIVTDKTNSVDQAPIVMIDRGSCHFVLKARNVQKAGGKVALVVNNSDDDISQTIMADDGSGGDIMIPMVLISKKDGQILKDYYSSNRNNKDALNKLRLDVDFQIEHPDNFVKVEVFMNSESEEIYEIISELSHFTELSKILFQLDTSTSLLTILLSHN